MSYSVLLERQAEKDLRNLPAQIIKRIDQHLVELEHEPFPRGALKLKGKEGDAWRIKIGDYRLLYTVDTSEKTINIYKIKHRRDVYR